MPRHPCSVSKHEGAFWRAAPPPSTLLQPLLLEQVDQVVVSLENAACIAERAENRTQALRCKRDKTLLLLGFWRGFRGDELSRLAVENITVMPGKGMICYLSQTKGDRQYKGTPFKVPMLNKLCPVDAYLDWQNAAQLTSGPVFRAVDRWGHISDKELHIDSIAPLLRSILRDGGITSSELYSSHSFGGIGKLGSCQRLGY